MDYLWPALHGGFGNLAAYLAAHVLLCLLPAFFIAGAMSALIPKSSITRFLGRGAPGYVAYPAAASAGSLLAVCSCTIVPLFAGIYKKGAGLGPAITFLFFAPAANILALVYTGGVIGVDLALARFILSLCFGIGIGLIMEVLFRAAEAARERAEADGGLFTGDEGGMRCGALVFLLLWIALLLAGTLKLQFLHLQFWQFSWSWPALADAHAWLAALVPFDAQRGEEGVSLQGAVLIVLLMGIGLASWRGIERIQLAGFNRWTRVALGLIGLTLLVAALDVRIVPGGGALIGFSLRWLLLLTALVGLMALGRYQLSPEERDNWLWESWRFVRQIFPLLVVGVFLVGILRVFIRPEWIELLAGSNTVSGNLAAVAFGVFMYFPTLVEVPIAHTFLQLGMHRGPLLAYLMADPELSLQSIIILVALIGRARTFAYVGLVALFSAVAGGLYGLWVDGAALWTMVAGLLLFLGLLGLAMGWAGKRFS